MDVCLNANLRAKVENKRELNNLSCIAATKENIAITLKSFPLHVLQLL